MKFGSRPSKIHIGLPFSTPAHDGNNLAELAKSWTRYRLERADSKRPACKFQKDGVELRALFSLSLLDTIFRTCFERSTL
ncbi:hypothetical protein [Bradyrhizobium sp. USDA 4518]